MYTHVMKRWRNVVLMVAVVLGLPCLVFARQPVLLSDTSTSIALSKPPTAYYGHLDGRPYILTVNAETPFTLYTSVLVPDRPETLTDITVAVEEITQSRGGSVV